MAWVGIGNGVTLVAGFASSILLARWLGVEGRGLYALIVATSLTASAILGNNAWVQAVAFQVGKKRYLPAQIVGHSVLIVVACGVLMVILLTLAPAQVTEALFPQLTGTHLWIIVLTTISILAFGMLSGLLLGLDHIPLLTSFGVFKATAALLFQIVLLGALNLGLRGALWELCLSGLLIVFMTAAVFTWKAGIDLGVRARCLKDVLGYGAKSYPGHLGVVLLSRLDIYFVALFGGVAAAGLYAVAKGLVDIVAIIEQSVSQAVMPRVISDDADAASAMVSGAFRVSFWLSAFVLMIGGLSARWLIPVIYGSEFAGGAPVFWLLSPGALLLTTRTLGTFFSMQLGRPEIPTYYVLAAGVVSVPLSYALTRQFGYLGAAAAFSMIAVLRGAAAIGLFMFFSQTKLKHVLVPSKADLLWLPRMILSWFGTHHSAKQKVEA